MKKNIYNIIKCISVSLLSLVASCDMLPDEQLYDYAVVTVSVCSAGNGSVAIKDDNGTSADFKTGATVTVVAKPDDGYAFSGWFVGDADEPVSKAVEYTFTVSKDVALTAMFEKAEINGHEYVDLGLSVKWATCNVGAKSPEEYGGYFAWGELDEKKDYDWDTYKWCNGSETSMTKYCTGSSYGTVDNKTVLDPEDDVAHVKWGGSWRMPTEAEQYELRTSCTWTWTTQNGVSGYKVISKTNGNSIFLPAAGYRSGTVLDYGGQYWSGSLYKGLSCRAFCLDIFSSGYDRYYTKYRYYGYSVRPVSE